LQASKETGDFFMVLLNETVNIHGALPDFSLTYSAFVQPFFLLWERKSINCASSVERQCLWHKPCSALLYAARLGDFAWLVIAMHGVISADEATILLA
jgi:RsiW-degrading membrane proteinase PrsW (M82 family)